MTERRIMCPHCKPGRWLAKLDEDQCVTELNVGVVAVKYGVGFIDVVPRRGQREKTDLRDFPRRFHCIICPRCSRAVGFDNRSGLPVKDPMYPERLLRAFEEWELEIIGEASSEEIAPDELDFGDDIF